jgi:putative transposase
MPQSLSLVLIHIVFSTMDRRPLIPNEILPEFHAYLATAARNNDCECYRVGGVADHVHFAVRLSRTTTIAKLVEQLKSNSSKWMKTKFPNFAWQNGYSTFSVGPTDLDALLHYIDTQEEHHKKYDFQHELLALLNKYGVEYDERYLWD